MCFTRAFVDARERAMTRRARSDDVSVTRVECAAGVRRAGIFRGGGWKAASLKAHVYTRGAKAAQNTDSG
eukprot:31205-Pelagococcus_subviridis.AAC.24